MIKKFAEGKVKIRHDSWPMYLYDLDEYDPEDAEKGLFRNFPLVRVSTILPFYPRLNFSSVSGFQTHIHKPRIGHELWETNEPIFERKNPWTAEGYTGYYRVCRVPCKDSFLPSDSQRRHHSDAYERQVRFALSTVESWRPRDGHFDMDSFYQRIIQQFNESEDEWVIETLAWWTKYVSFYLSFVTDLIL